MRLCLEAGAIVAYAFVLHFCVLFLFAFAFDTNAWNPRRYGQKDQRPAVPIAGSAVVYFSYQLRKRIRDIRRFPA